ncbi:UNVERIFIED_CONTAM: hypothetical protein Sangu_2614300 [Sesamum angustifolium]|uniref:Uncharacterized protein n=1 Tax=Sesamum angustifolium TaxID=2727405 RepID=A0AAW2J4U4_9LAMI
MVFDATGLAFWSSNYNQDGAPDYDQFHDVVHAAQHPLWNGYTQSQLGVVSELVDIKVLGAYPSLVEVLCFRSEQTEAWRHIDQTYSNFAVEPRMCMGREYMFLTMVIPSPSNPKYLIDVYLERVVELCILTCKSAKNETFTMCVVLMWTVNDLPAYRMAYEWSTTGVIGCPVCIENTRAFYMQNGRKPYYFDCYKQFLPPNHPYCRSKKTFTENRVERKVACPRLTENRSTTGLKSLVLRLKCRCHSQMAMIASNKWTKKSIFWEFEYWSTHLI